jgi:hypothetical protein
LFRSEVLVFLLAANVIAEVVFLKKINSMTAY